MTTPVEQIADIDVRIDRVLASLRRLETIKLYDAGNWQRAWDRHPRLHAIFSDLFRQRGEVQRERDALDHKEWQRQQRAQRRQYNTVSRTAA